MSPNGLTLPVMGLMGRAVKNNTGGSAQLVKKAELVVVRENLPAEFVALEEWSSDNWASSDVENVTLKQAASVARVNVAQSPAQQLKSNGLAPTTAVTTMIAKETGTLKEDVIKPDVEPPELPGWWQGLQSVVLVPLMMVGWYLVVVWASDRSALNNPDVGWLLFGSMLALVVLAMVAIAVVLWGGLGWLTTRATLWAYRGRWRRLSERTADTAGGGTDR